MSKGELVVEGSVDKLMKEGASAGRVRVEVQLGQITPELTRSLQQVKGVVAVERSGDLLIVICTEDLRPKIAKAVVDAGGSLIQMKIQSQALEDVYLKYFEEDAK
jgi:ABC-2 type transport system ATP-binding protein